MGEQLDTAVDVLSRQIDGRIAAYFSSCVHCGICAEACQFYRETGDPRYTPIYKLAPLRKIWRSEKTFWGKLGAGLGLVESLTEEDLAEWEDLIYDSCTMCGRCTMVCPVGNDIAYMVRKAREGFSAAGCAPEGLKGATRRALETGSPMGVKYKALKAQIGHAEKQTDLKIPVDARGADYLALFSSLEILGYPEYLPSIARIFHQAGVFWTLSSRAFEATNSGIQIGNSEAARELVGRIVDEAERLEVKGVISPECGHAYTAIRWDAPNLLGRKLPFRVLHILELLDELREEGRLKTTGGFEEKITFHDPCSIARKGGVLKEPRRLLRMIAPNFVEMKEHGEMNWCCGGGGGVSANERADPLKNKAFLLKKEQLEQIGVNTLVTACANCRDTLEIGLENNEMLDIEVLGITELIAESLAASGE